jgi:hypothetical protein
LVGGLGASATPHATAKTALQKCISRAYNANEKILGANLSGAGVPANTSLLAFGNGGLYTYSYIPTDKHPPATSNPLQGFTVGKAYGFTILGPGTANAALTLPGGETQMSAPYMNTQHDLDIPSGGTLKIKSLFGKLTSYTQQLEEVARVGVVPTSKLNEAGTGPAEWLDNRKAPLPVLNTVVNGVLDTGRVEIVDGWLSGTGTVKGSLGVFGPVSGYPDPIVGSPDPSWNNPANEPNEIKGTSGGFLVPGRRGGAQGGGAPGKLTVTGDVSLFGASLAVNAKGAAVQGSDYSWLAGDGAVHLGHSNLELSLISTDAVALASGGGREG